MAYLAAAFAAPSAPSLARAVPPPTAALAAPRSLAPASVAAPSIAASAASPSLLLGLAAVLAARRRGGRGRARGRALKVAAKAEEAKSAATSAAEAPAPVCSACGESFAAPRRLAAVAAGLAGISLAACSLPGPAQAKAKPGRDENGLLLKIDRTKCIECAGGGLQDCTTCRGTGQYKLMSLRDGDQVSNLLQFSECPECLGEGQIVCISCLGTGLGRDAMQGFLRKPEFKKMTDRMRRQKVTVNDIPQIQAEIQESLAMQKANRTKAAQAQAEQKDAPFFSPPSFSLPSLPFSSSPSESSPLPPV